MKLHEFSQVKLGLLQHFSISNKDILKKIFILAYFFNVFEINLLIISFKSLVRLRSWFLSSSRFSGSFGADHQSSSVSDCYILKITIDSSDVNMSFNYSLTFFYYHGTHFVTVKIHSMEVSRAIFFFWTSSVISFNFLSASSSFYKSEDSLYTYYLWGQKMEFWFLKSCD
jgi:hypothetical protein